MPAVTKTLLILLPGLLLVQLFLSPLASAESPINFAGTDESLVIDTKTVNTTAQNIKQYYEGAQGTATALTAKKNKLVSSVSTDKNGRTKTQQEALVLATTFKNQLTKNGALKGDAAKQNACSGVTDTSSGIWQTQQQYFAKQRELARNKVEYQAVARQLKIEKARYATDSDVLIEKTQNHAVYEAKLDAQSKKAQEQGLTKRMNEYAKAYREVILKLDQEEAKLFNEQRKAIDKEWSEYRVEQLDAVNNYYDARDKEITTMIQTCRAKPEADKIVAAYDQLQKDRKAALKEFSEAAKERKKEATKAIGVIVDQQVTKRKDAETQFAESSKKLKTDTYLDVFSKTLDKEDS